MRIAVARQEILQPHQFGIVAAADQNRARAALRDQRHPAQDEGAHEDLANLGGTDHQRAQMRSVERQRRAAVPSGAAHGQRLLAGERPDLAGELTGAECIQGNSWPSASRNAISMLPRSTTQAGAA